MPAEGWFTFTIGKRTATDIDGKCVIKIKQHQRDFYGTLAGKGREDVKIVAQGPCEGIYPGKYDDHFWIEGKFKGEVDSHKGTCRYMGYAQTWAGAPPTQELHMTLFKCGGGLKGMQGMLQANWEDKYSGWIRFAREH